MRVPFVHKDREYTIESFPIGDTGQWGCAIYPPGSIRGVALFEPDAVYANGKLVGLASDAEAIEAGRFHISAEFLRD
jgi:hypothetical protein